jgi:hypothetical protein
MELGPFNSLLSIGATGSRAQKIDLSRRRKQDHNLPLATAGLPPMRRMATRLSALVSLRFFQRQMAIA